MENEKERFSIISLREIMRKRLNKKISIIDSKSQKKKTKCRFCF